MSTSKAGIPHVLVVGAGSIGVNSAYFLAKSGAKVTLLDKADVCAGASWGNAGLIGHGIPLPSPGVVWQGIRWMLNPDSPFYIKPRLNLELWSWLWRFRAACTEKQLRKGCQILRSLSEKSMELYESFHDMRDFDFSFEKNGVMILYTSDTGHRDGLEEAKLLRSLGLVVEDFDRTTLIEKLGDTETSAIAGTYLPRDAQLSPADFVTGLALKAKDRGVEIKTHTEVQGFECQGRRVVGVQTSKGVERADEIVLAAGSWSPGVARSLDLRLPIQPAKGYSVTYERPANAPKLPLMLAEAKTSLTPMGAMLRIGGGLELSGMDLSINTRRVNAMLASAKQFLPAIDFDNLRIIRTWAGLRPIPPDGLPLLGRPKSFDNLTLAAGHSMMGISLGTASGMLVAQMVLRERPFMDIEAFGPDRFN